MQIFSQGGKGLRRICLPASSSSSVIVQSALVPNEAGEKDPAGCQAQHQHSQRALELPLHIPTLQRVCLESPQPFRGSEARPCEKER